MVVPFGSIGKNISLRNCGNYINHYGKKLQPKNLAITSAKINICGFTQIKNVAFTSATMANNISQPTTKGNNICQQNGCQIQVTITSVTKNNKKFGTNQ